MNHGLEGQTSTQRQGDFIRSILGWKFAAHNLSKDFKWQMSFQVCRGLIVQISEEYSDTWGLGYYQKKGPNKEPGLTLVMPMAKGIAQCKNQWIFVFSFSLWYPMCFRKWHDMGHFRKWNAHQMCEHFILVLRLYKHASRYTMNLGRGSYKPKNCTLDQPNIFTIRDPIVRLDRHCSGWVHIYTMLDQCFF